MKSPPIRRVCGHVLFGPVQPYKRRKNGHMVPLVGDPLYAPIQCMGPPGHVGDHSHTFVWSAANPDASKSP